MDKYTRPDYSSSALITIDTQQDTLDGQPMEIPGTSFILPKMKKLLDSFREKRKQIVHIVRIYKTDGSNVDLCRRSAVKNGKKFLAEGEKGSNLAEELLPYSNIFLNTSLLLSGKIQEIAENEVIIYKSRWGAFYKTRLEDYLKEKEINTLIFSGCNFPNCPRTSIYEASERDFKIVLVHDAMSGIYRQGIDEMKNIGVNVLSIDEIITELNGL